MPRPAHVDIEAVRTRHDGAVWFAGNQQMIARPEPNGIHVRLLNSRVSPRDRIRRLRLGDHEPTRAHRHDRATSPMTDSKEHAPPLSTRRGMCGSLRSTDHPAGNENVP
jgi:hypothetical protein